MKTKTEHMQHRMLLTVLRGESNFTLSGLQVLHIWRTLALYSKLAVGGKLYYIHNVFYTRMKMLTVKTYMPDIRKHSQDFGKLKPQFLLRQIRGNC